MSADATAAVQDAAPPENGADGKKKKKFHLSFPRRSPSCSSSRSSPSSQRGSSPPVSIRSSFTCPMPKCSR